MNEPAGLQTVPLSPTGGEPRVKIGRGVLLSAHWISGVFAALSLALAAWPAPAHAWVLQSGEQAAVDHFRAGLEATKLGQFDRAVEEYKKVLAIDPDLVEARVNLGLAYHSLGQYTLAVRELSRASRERSNLLGPSIILGIDYLKLGFPEKAVPSLQRALSLDASNREGRRALAMCYLAQGKYVEAASEFRTVFSFESEKVEANFALGHDYLGMATQLVARLARAYPDSAWGYRLAGDVLSERGLWNDALQEYRLALSIDPTQPGLYVRLGRGQLQQTKVREASEDFRRELALDSRSEEAWLGLAQSQLAEGATTAALESVGRIWQISPPLLILQQDAPLANLAPDLTTQVATEIQGAREGPAKHFLLLLLYRKAGETEEADKERLTLQHCVDAWKESPSGVAAEKEAPQPCSSHLYARCAEVLQSQGVLDNAGEVRLGKAFWGLREFEKAADAFGGALAMDSNNVEAMYWLIQVYLELAGNCLTNVEVLGPDSWRAHQLRGETYKLRQAGPDAIQEYQLAVRLQPNNAELHETLGELYFEKHSYDEARAELERSLALDSSRARTLLLLGRLYVRQHESEKGIPYLQEALRYQPEMSEARAVLGTAYLRLGDAESAVRELQKAAGLDYYGNINYQLFLAYRKLGKTESAQKALARSQELRRKSAEFHQAKVAGAIEVE